MNAIKTYFADLRGKKVITFLGTMVFISVMFSIGRMTELGYIDLTKFLFGVFIAGHVTTDVASDRMSKNKTTGGKE